MLGATDVNLMGSVAGKIFRFQDGGNNTWLK